MSQSSKQCKDCGREFPETRDYFGQYKNIKVDGTNSIGYRNSCRQCMAANSAKNTYENKDKKILRVARRANHESQSGGSYSPEDISAIKIKLGNKCRFCSAPLDSKPHIEHLTPVSRGGSSNPKNLTLSCIKCNLAKTNKTLTEFQIWRSERGLENRIIKPEGENPDQPVGSPGRHK